tara:strand:- start:361 stop:657 length:297 start_codon:yes stop_codon:yes gene_type:complete
MSLTITSPITTLEGIELPTSYARVSVTDQVAGASLQSTLSIFASESAYLAEARAIKTNIETSVSNPYDRLMGTDILDLAHDFLIDSLAQQGVTATKNL